MRTADSANAIERSFTPCRAGSPDGTLAAAVAHSRDSGQAQQTERTGLGNGECLVLQAQICSCSLNRNGEL